MGFLSLFHYYQRKPSRQILNSAVYTINKEFSALNFLPTENSVKSKIENEINLRYYYISSVVKKWFAIILLGVFIGTLGAFQAIIIEEIFIFKYNTLSESIRSSLIGSSFLWLFWTTFPILVCTCFIMQLEPNLKGSGVSSVIAYLNGVRIRRFHKAWTLWLQYLSVFLISAANMPGGREELFIQIGALSGACLSKIKMPYTNWKPFKSLSEPTNRRTLVAAGTAAGVAVSFGTPIGAVLFCLEEGLTFWSPDLTFMMFLCAVCSNFVLHLSYAVYVHRGDFSFEFMYYLFFSGVKHIQLTYKFLEIPIFFLMGVVGGLLGSLWNEGHIQLHIIRKKYIKTQVHKMLEVLLLGALLSACGILTFHIFGSECTRQFEKGNRISRSKEMKKYCKGENQFESVGIFLFQDLRHIIKTLFLVNKELISSSVLLFGTAYYFIFSGLQLGTYLPSGILVPHLVCGASWGYLFGVWYSNAFEENLIVAKYAFLGAVAQGSGAARLTLSLGIIMIESCGKQMFAIPIFIIVVTAKWFGGIFSRPIYRIEAYLEGYPFLRATYLPLSIPHKAKHIMVPSMVTVSKNMSIEDLITVLRSNNQPFPVIENGKVMGIITKYQIAILLKTKTYRSPDNRDEMHVMYETFQEYEGESFIELEEVMHSSGNLNDPSTNVDLTKVMDSSPNLINSEMSLRRIYYMFVALGLSYVIVVDDSLNPLGIITRKEVASFRKLTQFLLMRTEVVPIV